MIKFDTLDKKPKLWNLAVLTAVFAAIIIPFAVSKEQNLALAACVLQCIFFLIVPVLLFRAFVRQLRYNPYSYNTVFYFGFSVFSIFVLIAQIKITVQAFQYPDSFSLLGLIGALLSSAKDFMLISSPFLFLFSAALFISNIALIRHEGFRIVNLLGIALSLLTVSGIVLIFFFDRYASGSQFEVMMHDLVTNLFSAIYLYFECMLLGTMFADAITARYEPEKDKDYMIILGCGLKKDGTPTPLLKGRIDRAIDFYNKQKAITGKELTFITSGGKGPDEIVSESASMKKYLTEHGIPEERVIEEDKSTDTFENMKYSKEKIADVTNAKIAFSTTGYHVFRSGIFARRVKMRAVGIGSKTKWYFWPNAAVREFVGLLTKHRLKQALILGGMIAFYVALTLLIYM
ncbi:MAG: YdcF family protein [Clostridia bacterium]|nr:YdcF family protein [Clostridia bacterium]